MKTAPALRDSWINPRFTLASLWVSMLFVFAYVDIFSLYRADIRADLDAGEMAGATVGQGFLVGVTAYIVPASLMVFLTLVLRARLARSLNIVMAVLYGLTVMVSAFDDWTYFVIGSAIEALLLAGIVYTAWTWPHERATALGRANE